MAVEDWFLSASERGNPATRLDRRHGQGLAWTAANNVEPTLPAAGSRETVFRERWEDPAPMIRNPIDWVSEQLRHDDSTPNPLPPELPDPAPAVVIDATVSYDAQKLIGLAGAANARADRAYGPWLLSFVALRLVEVGLFGLPKSSCGDLIGQHKCASEYSVLPRSSGACPGTS